MVSLIGINLHYPHVSLFSFCFFLAIKFTIVWTTSVYIYIYTNEHDNTGQTRFFIYHKTFIDPRMIWSEKGEWMIWGKERKEVGKCASNRFRIFGFFFQKSVLLVRWVTSQWWGLQQLKSVRKWHKSAEWGWGKGMGNQRLGVRQVGRIHRNRTFFARNKKMGKKCFFWKVTLYQQQRKLTPHLSTSSLFGT